MDEVDEAAKLVKKLMLGISLFLLVVLLLFLASYKHPMPAKDCSHPYDYPVCERAYVAQALQPHSIVMAFLGIILTAALALVLVYASYESAVHEQANIITPTANVASASAQVSANPAESKNPR
jgi:hypothetical protein